VFTQGFQHVVEERHGAFDLMGACPVQVQGEPNLGLFGFSLNGRGTLGHMIPAE
jgi:hypothetical protein